jgi:hypothetical protein
MHSNSGALEQALEIFRSPSLLRVARERPLPDGMQTLLSLVAGDDGTLQQAAAATGESNARLTEAATFYIQQVLFTPGIDSYRVLGVNADASDHRIKDHRRLLMRWLHPDRNPDGWDNVYVDRVNRAWQDLRSQDRRREYDLKQSQKNAAIVPRGAAGPRPEMPMPLHHPPLFEPAIASSRAVRVLPALVLGSLSVAAALLVAFIYSLRPQEETLTAPRPVVVSVPSPPASLPLPVVERRKVAPVQPRGADHASPAGPETYAVLALPAAKPSADPAIAQAKAPTSRTSAEAKPPTANKAIAPSGAVASNAVPSSAARPKAAAAAQTTGAQSLAAARELPVAAKPAVSESVPVLAESKSVPKIEKPVAVQVAATSPAPNDRSAVELLHRFSQAYDRGDLPQLMAMFTRDARNRVEGQQTLADHYRALFETSQERRLSLSSPSWRIDGDHIRVVVGFETAILPLGKRRAQRTVGDMRLDLRRVGGELLIASLSHDER